MILDLTPTEAAAVKEAITEAIQDDAEQLATPESFHGSTSREEHVRERFAALLIVLSKLSRA